MKRGRLCPSLSSAKSIGDGEAFPLSVSAANYLFFPNPKIPFFTQYTMIRGFKYTPVYL